MPLHCKSKGRTTACQFTQEAPTNLLNNLPEMGEMEEEKEKMWFFPLTPSLSITFLRQDNKVI